MELPLLRMREGPTRDAEENLANLYVRPCMAFGSHLLTRNFYMTSSCGVCGKASLDALRIRGYGPLEERGPVVAASVVEGLPAKVRAAQRIFAQTGGLHAAALCDPGGTLLTIREDVGRHNAVDKLIGHHLLAGALPLEGRLLQLAGRASWELVRKAMVARIPIIVVVGAPSSVAIDLAQEFGITLIGFARPASFNVYTHPQRILAGEGG